MIPNAKPRDVTSSDVGASEQFGISRADEAHIMTILRDTLYSDKVLAVLREYGSNAWDANREAGKEKTPIKVTLPTLMDPTLTIQDFGLGMSQDDVMKVYTQYGASTKRNSDLSVGMLGIGCKSAFAYSDSFTVVSRHDGEKKTYVAVIDKSEKGMINLLHTEKCEKDDTGVTIQVAVRKEDIQEFERKAQKVFQFFIPRPKINTQIPKLPEAFKKLDSGIIWTRNYDAMHQGWVAVMGCVAYRIDLAQLQTFDVGLPGYVSRNTGALYFSIGEVEISASREDLKYTTKTKKALVARLNKLVEEFVKSALDEIDSYTGTIWSKRIKAQDLRELNLPIPDTGKDLVVQSVDIKDKIPADIAILNLALSYNVTSIRAAHETKLILADTNKTLEGYNLSPGCLLIGPAKTLVKVPEDGASGATATKKKVQKLIKAPETDWVAFRKRVDEMCKAAGIEGIPITSLSLLTWTPQTRHTNGRTVNVKHRVKAFKYNESRNFSVRSQCWDVVSRVPEDDDVFVVISEFCVNGYNFFGQYTDDKRLMHAFAKGQSMPAVYGYKTTLKKPVLHEHCKGIEYRKWSLKFREGLVTPYVVAELTAMHWIDRFSAAATYSTKVLAKKYKLLVDELGMEHFVTKMFKNVLAARRYFIKKGGNRKDQLGQLRNALFVMPKESLEADEAIKTLYETYPLLKHATLTVLWNDPDGAQWRDYIHLIDSVTLKGKACPSPSPSPSPTTPSPVSSTASAS